MPKIGLQDMSGNRVGDLELKSEVFEAVPNVPLMHQAVIAEEANTRQGTADTKARSEVRGGGRKPYRQKGTGRARQGSIRAIQWRGGGVVFGPTPRSYRQATPKKMRRGAIRSALSARLADGALVVCEEIKLDTISTKQMAAFLDGCEAYGKTLVVLDTITDEITKSTRNIPGIELRISPAVSARDVLNADKIIFTRAAIEKLQEVLAQ